MKAIRKLNNKNKLKNNEDNNSDDKIKRNTGQSSSKVEEPVIEHEQALALINYGKLPEQATEEDYRELEEIVKVNEIVTYSMELFKFNTVSVIQKPISSSNDNFNQMEFFKLWEFFRVMKNLEINVNNAGNVNLNETEQECFFHGSYFYEDHTRKLIKTIKMLNSFNVIDNTDKMTLVKHSAFEILIMRSVLRYNEVEESWKYPVSYLFKNRYLK